MEAFQAFGLAASKAQIEAQNTLQSSLGTIIWDKVTGTRLFDWVDSVVEDLACLPLPARGEGALLTRWLDAGKRGGANGLYSAIEQHKASLRVSDRLCTYLEGSRKAHHAETKYFVQQQIAHAECLLYSEAYEKELQDAKGVRASQALTHQGDNTGLALGTASTAKGVERFLQNGRFGPNSTKRKADTIDPDAAEQSDPDSGHEAYCASMDAKLSKALRHLSEGSSNSKRMRLKSDSGADGLHTSNYDGAQHDHDTEDEVPYGVAGSKGKAVDERYAKAPSPPSRGRKSSNRAARYHDETGEEEWKRLVQKSERMKSRWDAGGSGKHH